MIKNFLQRAKLISSSRTLFLKELSNIKRTLVNNGFPNRLVDEQISVFLHNFSTNPSQPDKKSIDLYYRNQFHQSYRQDESVIKDILKKCISPVDLEFTIKLIVYYKKFKTANLIIRNAPPLQKSHVSLTNVVYQFKCPLGGSIPYHQDQHDYVGHTVTSLSRRLTTHLSENSAVRQHLNQHKVNDTLLRDILVNNTRILYKESCFKRLLLLEALAIKDLKPTLNKICFDQGLRILDVFAN